MKNRQEKIEVIYEKIARKKLTFGCSFLCQKGTDKSWIRRVIIATIGDDFLTVFPDFPYQKITSHPFIDRVQKNCVLKTIGHPVMLGDVLDFYWDKKGAMTLDRILRFWEKKSASIEEQSDRCVDYIYGLIS